jgi:hypothetical protein
VLHQARDVRSWSGPKAGPRKLALRWLPPIAVRLDDAVSLPAVVHPVKSDQPYGGKK